MVLVLEPNICITCGQIYHTLSYSKTCEFLVGGIDIKYNAVRRPNFKNMLDDKQFILYGLIIIIVNNGFSELYTSVSKRLQLL